MDSSCSSILFSSQQNTVDHMKQIRKGQTMKKITSIILTAGLFLGFASSSFAVSSDSGFANTTNQRLQQYRATVSPETMLGYNQVLLERSSVAAKLKFSSNYADKARYEEAVAIYQKATQAHQDGDFNKAKQLALESIRVIARSVPQYYNRVAKTNQ